MDKTDFYHLNISFDGMRREEKLGYIFEAFMAYPSALEAVRKNANRAWTSRHDMDECTYAFIDYERILSFLAKCSRDKDSAVSHFGKTVYRAALDTLKVTPLWQIQP